MIQYTVWIKHDICFFNDLVIIETHLENSAMIIK